MSNYLGRTVMRQFSNSPTLLALLEDFDQWVDTTQFTNQFLAYVWDISTAQGFGLDIWGRILGQSRYLQIAQTPGDNFGFNINPVGGLVNAINQEFAVGNGATNVFQLTGPGHEPANNTVVVSSMYRNDWQGNQLLYATARTNAITRSQQISLWSLQSGGTGTAPAVTDNYAAAPDGTPTASRVIFARGSGTTSSDYSRVAEGVTTVAGLPYALGVWLRSTDGLSTYTLQLSFNGQGATILTVGPTWQYFTATIASALDTNRYFRLDTQGGAATSQNADILMWGGMHVQGTATGSYIPTTTAAVTVTDYAATSGGVVTMGQVPVASAVLVWNGTFIGNVSGTQWQPWGQAPFYGGSAAGTVAFPLQDQYYRQLLLVKAAANIATCDCPSINALMRAMFGNRGRCYVGYDIANPMHIGYHFEFFPTPVEKSIIESGLFPQPAGTTATYIYELIDYSPFGFAGMNTGADPKYVTGWNQGPFYQPGAAGGDMLNNSGGPFILDQSQLG